MLGDGLLQDSITIGNQRPHLIILSLHSLKGLLPLVLICWESVDVSEAAFLVSLTVMWNPIAVSLCSRPHLLLWSSTSSRWRGVLDILTLVRSFTDMLGGRAEIENCGWVVMSFCLLSRGSRGKWKLWWTGGGVCSAVSGRAGHLITERVLLHHHQSHAGSLLPPSRPCCCGRSRAQDMDCGLSARALEGLE